MPAKSNTSTNASRVKVSKCAFSEGVSTSRPRCGNAAKGEPAQRDPDGAGRGRREVVGLVLGRGLRIVAAGTGLGLVAAYAGARLLERQLFGVPAADLATFVSVPLVLLVAVAVACWVPARRAARR